MPNLSMGNDVLFEVTLQESQWDRPEESLLGIVLSYITLQCQKEKIKIVDFFIADILHKGLVPLQRETKAAMPILSKRVL